MKKIVNLPLVMKIMMIICTASLVLLLTETLGRNIV